MSVRVPMRQALSAAMRARDKVAVNALRAALAALDNAEAVPPDATAPAAGALEAAPFGAGATEVARRELTEHDVQAILRAEVTERLTVAQQLTAPPHAERADRLRAEAGVLLRFLDGGRAAPA